MFWKSIKLYQAFEEKLGQSTIGYRFNQLNYYFHSIMFMKLLLHNIIFMKQNIIQYRE